MSQVSVPRCGWLGPPVAIECRGSVSTAVGSFPDAAKARVIGSELRNGGSVNSKRGLAVRRTLSPASYAAG
jgi:hypothetical protein